MSKPGCVIWRYATDQGSSLQRFYDLIVQILWRIKLWRHKRKTFPHYTPLWGVIHRSPVKFPHPLTYPPRHKGQWRRALVFSLISAWTNSWLNNRDVGDLRHHRVYHVVTVMFENNDPVMPLIYTGRTAQLSWYEKKVVTDKILRIKAKVNWIFNSLKLWTSCGMGPELHVLTRINFNANMDN